MKKKYSGTIVPVITPLNADLTLDVGAVERLFLLFRENGVQPFILGTTGEAVSLPAIGEAGIHAGGGAVKKAGRYIVCGDLVELFGRFCRSGAYCF